MDKIQKLLKKLQDKDRRAIIERMKRLMIGNWQGLDVDRVGGEKNVFRCRVGNFRIIFSFANGVFDLREIKRRNESTYRNY